MNAERLLFAFTDIDDYFIEAAKKSPQNRSKKRAAVWASLAACIAVIVVGFFVYNNQPDKELPMLSVADFDSSGMGMEAYWAYSIDELINKNPWTPDSTPQTLPVYKNELYSSMSTGNFESTDRKELEKLLLDAAKKLGMDTGKLSPLYDSRTNTLYVEDENYHAEITPGLNINVTAKNKSALPEGYTLGYYESYDEYHKSAEYLIDKFSDFLEMDKPVININGGDYDIYGRRSLHLEIYDGEGNAKEQIKAYNFESVRFYTDDDGLLHISKSCRDSTYSSLGSYPIISADKALDMLLDGNYVTSVFQEIKGKEKVKKVELVYHTSLLSEAFMPYYKFYVEIEHTGDIEKDFPGIKIYGAYYVPAVESRYIKNLPQRNGHIN
ncbi:MAG: hypothetical protein IJA02_11465 [Clostridia bacterium]|nr:hypothetical protein [Clostridia bacterium]